MAARINRQSGKADGVQLLTWLADPANRRLLAESWFWKRFLATSTPAAIVHLVDARVTGAPLRWPGDIGRPPSPESQIVILCAAWLRGLVDLPGLDAPVVRWTEAEISAFAADQVAVGGLPWFAIADEASLHTILIRTRGRVYGGNFEIVQPDETISQIADTLSCHPVTKIAS